MDSSLSDRAESDVYRMSYEDDASSSSRSTSSGSEHEFSGDMHRSSIMSSSVDDLLDLDETPPQAQGHRPPPISTDWDTGEGTDAPGEVEVAVDEPESTRSHARVSFNVPPKNDTQTPAAPASSRIHFQDPKRRGNASYASPYPTQSLRQSGLNLNAADAALEEAAAGTGGGRPPRRANVRTPRQAVESLAEVTPAFLRRAAQDLGVANKGNAAAKRSVVPPNSLVNRRDRSAPSNDVISSSIPDSSFFGADASALDGTFVSIRDLNDDDDVPSVDNDQWNSVAHGKGGDGAFPTESTSLLGKNKMPWQGGFFGSQMEKEDRKERRKMRMRARQGWLSDWAWTIRSFFWTNGKGSFDRSSGRGSQWEATHPIGSDFMPQRNAQTTGLPRQRTFSIFLIWALCFHLAFCGLHDLFLRYISYRNPTDDEEASVSWNGEGQYIPAYWLSFDGRVLNPLIGPGARTLTAFGALVPGLVLSKGQGWRVATSFFESSSFVELILHIWVLKTAVGGPMAGIEWTRGTFVAALLFFISAVTGSAWSIAVEPGRLVTASGMGIAGLLAASSVERLFFPLASKDDEEEGNTSSQHNGNGSNAVSSSSNEQFTFQPSNSQKKKRRNPLSGSPSILLLLEILASWWSTYASLAGTATAAMAGGTCALLLFVGSPPPGSFDSNANQDLMFTETPPPPPPSRYAGDNWRDDDDSADTSIGSDRHAFKTPLMRRSILADEDDEEELGTRSTVRRRNVSGGYTVKTPGIKGRTAFIKSNESFSPSRVIARVVGVLLALLLTLIPASLIATGDGPSTEMMRASVLGCRPMRILYKEDDSSDVFECAGGCVPLSRERAARRSEGMRAGRCDAIGYRCYQQSGTMTLRNYEVPVGIYTVQSGGSCATAYADDGDEQRKNNDDANLETVDANNNGEVEGVQ